MTIVSARVYISSARKIDCIKLVRSSFGIGLKEAKDFVEAAQASEQEVFLTADQYVRLVLGDRDAGTGIQIFAAQIIERPVIKFDFTGSQPHAAQPQPVAFERDPQAVECSDPNCRICERDDYEDYSTQDFD